MQGTIELHGAKQVLNTGSSVIEIESTKFIPGDLVSLDSDNGPRLIKRVEQKVIAVVRSIVDNVASLYVVNFGPTCPFCPTLWGGSYLVGNRLILQLDAVGTFKVVEGYSSDPKYDVNCLLDMYRFSGPRPVENGSTMGDPLYTKEGVIDHNDLDTFTIDPSTSVDFDDAISVDVANNTVYVHIVDIAGQAISDGSRDRLRNECFSLYLSNEHTEHLLDGNEAAFSLSLIVGHERPVITIKTVLDDDGLVVSYDIYRSTIVVKYRFNYEVVAMALAFGCCSAQIVYLNNLTKKRNSAVNYNINLPSVRILSDYETGDVQSVAIEETNDDAHSLVATTMILANLTVSKHLSERGIILPNRFHESLKGVQIPQFKRTGNVHVDSFILVKRYARACYAVDRKGHFGLGLTDYVHFTSPMRRYADVLVHKILAGHKFADLEGEVVWINQRSSLVRAAQTMYLNWKKMRWLESLGNVGHEIWVTGVAKSGILWFMPSLNLNGFIHLSSLEPKQYWMLDQGALSGNCGSNINVGDRLTGFVKKIDSVTSEISLVAYVV